MSWSLPNAVMAATCIKLSSSPPSPPPDFVSSVMGNNVHDKGFGFYCLGASLRYSGGAVRPLPVRIITVGKKRSRGVQLLVDEYMEKLKNYCSMHDVQIKSNPKNTSDVNRQIQSEDNVVMQHIRPQDWVVVLDEQGLDIGSEKMAQLVGDAYKTGSTSLTFCIGGSYGHGLQLRQRADVTIRLSNHGPFSKDRTIIIDMIYTRLQRKTSYDLTRFIDTEINVLHIERERGW